MTEKLNFRPAERLKEDYQEAIVACGLVDDIAEMPDLDPKPLRYTEGEYICRRGDAAECLWIIVTGSVAVKEGNRTLFTRRNPEVVGEQNLLGNGYRRMYDLVANEASVEILAISKEAIENCPEKAILYRNIARIISLKLKRASAKVASLSRQLEDDTQILHAYTNQYALSRRMQAGGSRQSDYKVDRAIVLFSDVVDFSRYTLTMAPERAADIIQRFFNAQSLPIAEHGGHIDKFIGDGLMAFWILPVKGDAAKFCMGALRAAEQAVKSVAEIRVGQAALHLRVGLHVGRVLSGDFGSTTRNQFTLIGPEVNKAARLEQIHREDVVDGDTDIGSIRLSADFHRELSGPMKRRYHKRSVAKAKNIGDIEFYS